MIERDYQKTQWTGAERERVSEKVVKRMKVREKVLYEGQKDEKVTEAGVCAWVCVWVWGLIQK